MPNIVKSLFRWLAIGYVTYLAVSLFIVLPLLNFMAPRLVNEATGRELRSELVFFNPFTLAVEVRGATLHERDGHQPLGFRKLRVDLSLASLWNPGIVLDSFIIESLDVHILRYADGGFHFADLLESEPDDDSDEATAVPAITIDDIIIDAHTLRYTDRTRPGEFSTVQRDFRLATRNVTTVPGRSGDGNLELTSDGGGRLRWDGEMNIGAGQSRGVVTLENIDLTHIWRYNADILAFVVHNAAFDARLDYRLDWADELQFILDDSSLRLHRTDIRPAAPQDLPHSSVALADLSLDGLALDLQAQALSLSAVSIRGLKLQGYDEDGQPSLATLFALPENAMDGAATASDDDDTTPQGEDAEEPWQLSVGEVTLDDSAVLWKTGFLAPDVMELSPIRFEMSELRWPANAPSPFALTLAINADTALDLSGALNIGSGAGEGRLAMSGWQLPWINPVWTEQLRTDISQGVLGFETQFSLVDFAPQRAAFAVELDRFATRLHETGEEAFTLEKLALSGGEIIMDAQTLRIAELALERPTGSLHMREDGTININGVVRDVGGAPSASEASSASAAEAPTEAAPEALADSSETDWRVLLELLQLRNGRLDFADDSLPLPFQTRIDSVEADISDLDTASEKPLAAELRGSVDGYAPVLIRASGTPLSDQRDARLELSFRGMDIATMSPYSGTYAGYTIDSGTLNLDLQYALSGQTMDGDNRIKISQMELGEPIDSDLAIDVPLKLGLALLTDSKGVIDLSVPVSGNIDDPSFSLGAVIGKAITNVFVKAVTAPFKLLAGLVGSEDDLEHVAFAPGTSVVDEAATRALAALAEALQQRPQLSLRIVGSSDPLADGRALREAQLAEALIAEGLSNESITARDDAYQAAVNARYAALALAPDSDSDSQAAETPELAVLEDAVLNALELPRGAMESLATQRAAAAKRSLVNDSGIDAARIAISSDPGETTAGVTMRVDS
jgi:hypothetical protein